MGDTELKITGNRDELRFNDGSVYNLGYWVCTDPNEAGNIQNVITNSQSLLTTNAFAYLDQQGNYHGLDGVKTDINGNIYEGSPSGKWVKITGVNGGSHTFQLDSTYNCLYMTKAPVDFNWGDIHTGDYLIRHGSFGGANEEADRYRYSLYRNGLTFDECIETADVIYHQFDNKKLVWITIFSDAINKSGFVPCATVCKVDQRDYHYGSVNENPMSVSMGGYAFQKLSTLVSGYIPVEDTENTDPYSDGGSTYPGGGGGSFDTSSDPVSIPDLPTLSALNTGFVSLWRPSSLELANLYNYLWSSAFDLESFKKIFANPIDALMGFGIIPLNPVVSTPRSLKIGNISTDVNLTPITQQYYQLDCGTLYLENFFNTYLEFEPYSTLEIFLPFCGCMPLSSDDFYRRKEEYRNGGKINVTYNIDILSGSCVAFLSCYDAKGHTTMTYEFNGNVLTQIPITGNDFTGLYNAVLGIAGNVVSGVAHAATGNAAGILGDVVNAAHNVTSAKPSINRSGTIGGSYGLLANRKPFLIRNIPREAVAWAQNTFQGYPSHITTVIRSINGYTEFEKVYTDNIPASDNELKEIVQILETGVIL